MKHLCCRVLVDRLIETEEKQRGEGGTVDGVKEEEEELVDQGDGGGQRGETQAGLNLRRRLRSGSTKSSAATMELELDSDMLDALGDIITDLGPSSA